MGASREGERNAGHGERERHAWGRERERIGGREAEKESGEIGEARGVGVQATETVITGERGVREKERKREKKFERVGLNRVRPKGKKKKGKPGRVRRRAFPTAQNAAFS